MPYSLGYIKQKLYGAVKGLYAFIGNTLNILVRECGLLSYGATVTNGKIIDEVKAGFSPDIFEGDGHNLDYASTQQNSQTAAYSRGDKRVESSLEGEQADDMTSLCPHRPGDAQFTFTFRRQHDKDKKDEQDTGYYRKTTEEDEYRGEATPGHISHFQRLLLDRLSLKSGFLKPG